MMSALAALEKLRLGNQQFVDNLRQQLPIASLTRPTELVAEQNPFAIILGCSDSRVPAEIVFNQGLGDLFVIRVAGNIVAPSQVGSIEFAAERYKTRLVVVLGHTRCGAILATLEELDRESANRSPNLRAIVERILPAVETLWEAETLRRDRPALIHHAVRANIRASVNQLRHGSAMLENLTQNHGLLIVGAEYSLETGEVVFFDKFPHSP